MIEKKTVYFESPGSKNTDETLKIAKAYAEKENIDHILVASTYGDTGLKAAKTFAESKKNLICVLHQYGFKEEGKICADQKTIDEIKKHKAQVLINTDVFTTVGRAFRSVGFSQMDIVSNTFRTLSQGIKVAVEIAIMASDVGLVPKDTKVISIGGTGRGADTAIVITPKDISRLFEIKIHEIICKPNSF